MKGPAKVHYCQIWSSLAPHLLNSLPLSSGKPHPSNKRGCSEVGQGIAVQASQTPVQKNP
jgi:hypothetical protein